MKVLSHEMPQSLRRFYRKTYTYIEYNVIWRVAPASASANGQIALRDSLGCERLLRISRYIVGFI